MPDPWAVLGLPRDAPWDDVRAAHRRLAKELHPDVAGTDTDHRRMAEVNAAFALLAAQIPRTGGPDLRNSSIHAASSELKRRDQSKEPWRPSPAANRSAPARVSPERMTSMPRRYSLASAFTRSRLHCS